ncbi:hypothetical protein E2C01_093855 [Portunus trituberculatus]|uniref:Uncharacterized protein n=1 Tax=Portunus trituberculatus TaxID=210409 RepID=A0A5B7JQY2_PORTR|nr:hypothetical protein [Portunus trituberculatus]
MHLGRRRNDCDLGKRQHKWMDNTKQSKTMAVFLQVNETALMMKEKEYKRHRKPKMTLLFRLQTSNLNCRKRKR